MDAYVGSIERTTLNNPFFRQVLFTREQCQLVVMSIQPGDDIGNEVHAGTDQFFRVEEGEGKFVFNASDEHVVGSGDAVVVPAGTHHNVINTSRTKPLRLYTVYSPPNHPPGTVHQTKADAVAAEHGE